MDVFRGKDFYRFLRQNPEKMDPVLPEKQRALGTEEKIAALGNLMIEQQYFVRSERFFPRPYPGREKLVKWPIRVSQKDDQTFEESSFYTWLHQRPASPWVNFAAGAAVVLVLAACLFPLAPMWAKKVVFYVSLSVLILMFAVMMVRIVVYVACWVVAGKHIWLLPNILSDHLPANEIFFPLIEETRDRHGKTLAAPSLVQRLGMVAAIIGACYWLYATAPEKGYGVSLKSQHDDLLDILGIESRRIAGNTTEGAGDTTSGANATAGGEGGPANASAAEGAAASGASVDPQATQQEL